jgi:menaquinone-dependent protoporphyrinogen oxidase
LKVLVVYDTKNGSTAEVAKAIASRLRERGCSVEARPSRDVRDVAVGFLVVGAPLYSGRWLSGGHRILKRVTKLERERRPVVAAFALGPRRDEGPEDWERPRSQFESALAKHPAITPASTALFGGADPPKKTPRRDIRDWEAIRSWADELAAIFGCL